MILETNEIKCKIMHKIFFKEINNFLIYISFSQHSCFLTFRGSEKNIMCKFIYGDFANDYGFLLHSIFLKCVMQFM